MAGLFDWLSGKVADAREGVGQALQIPQAFDFSNQMYPDQGDNGTQQDAARHAYWQAMLTQKYGRLPAWLAGLLHEAQGTLTGQSFNDLMMDLHNNSVARDLGANALTPEGVQTLIRQKMQNSRMQDPGLFSNESPSQFIYYVPPPNKPSSPGSSQ